jgi:hypothetical protein
MNNELNTQEHSSELIFLYTKEIRTVVAVISVSQI